MGLHKIANGISDDALVAMAQRLFVAGKPLAIFVVINNKSLANRLVPYVKRVVFRWQPDSGVYNPIFPTGTPVEVRRFGYEWMAQRWTDYADLDPSIFIQPTNEGAWSPSDNDGWLGIMDFVEERERKCAILNVAVGNPPDDFTSAESKWQSLTVALEHARAGGHVVGMHIYSKAGTPEGALSDDLSNYELRFRRLYQSVPENARPPLLILEAAREFYTGKFANTSDTLNWLVKLQNLLRQDAFVEGIAAWTAGKDSPWLECSIDAAIPAYEQAILAGRYPNTNAPFELIAPVANPYITQGFGANPAEYNKWGLPGHEGLDYRAAVGSQILATADGVISEIREDGGKPWQQYPYGNQLRISHRDGEYTTVYAHLSEITCALGQRVAAGDVVALSGNTGNSSGPHLHFTLKRRGSTAMGSGWPNDIVNPLPYMAKRSQAVEEAA